MARYELDSMRRTTIQRSIEELRDYLEDETAKSSGLDQAIVRRDIDMVND